MLGFLRPSPTLSPREVRSSLRMMTLEGLTSEALATVQIMGYLAAYALALGANNLQVGIVSAVPFATLVIQLPAILLIERFRVRKAIGLPAWLLAQLLMVPVGAVPFFLDVPSPLAVLTVIFLLAFRGLFAPLWITAWMSWMHDLVPRSLVGGYYGAQAGGQHGGAGGPGIGSELLRQLVGRAGAGGTGGLRILVFLHCGSANSRRNWPPAGCAGQGAADACGAGRQAVSCGHTDGAAAGQELLSPPSVPVGLGRDVQHCDSLLRSLHADRPGP